PATGKSGAQLGLGIGSEDVAANSTKDNAKALTKDMYDTLVKAFEANDASTVTTATSENNGECATENKKTCGSAVKAGNAFEASSSRLRPMWRGLWLYRQELSALYQWRKPVVQYKLKREGRVLLYANVKNTILVRTFGVAHLTATKRMDYEQICADSRAKDTLKRCGFMCVYALWFC
ncbi:MAG: hypothetical protein ACTJLK_02190, partial [Anaplasma sp.]